MAKGTLTNKQLMFVNEYLRDFNATQAALRSGYSKKTARSIGAENLTKPDVWAAIKSRVDEKVMGVDETLTRLSDMARGDIADLMDISTMGYTFRLIEENENGERIVNPHTKLIKKIKQKVTTIMPRNEQGEEREIVENELELYSAQDALRDIGKYHALFVDKHEVRGADGNALEIFVRYADRADTTEAA